MRRCCCLPAAVCGRRKTAAPSRASAARRLSLIHISLFVAQRLSPLDDVLSTATHFVLRTYKKDGVMYTDENKDERGYNFL